MRTSLCVFFWIAVGLVYVLAGARQRQTLNLSAAAGGQHPYLTYARGIAEQGLTGHFGDRNRMPLFPAMLAPGYHPDEATFFERSVWIAIASSAGVLVLVGWFSARRLGRWGASVLVLSAAAGVFLYRASFVGADLVYYGVSFVAWVCLAEVLQRGDWKLGMVAGTALATAYLTKASALLMLPVFAVASLTALVWRAQTGSRPRQVDRPVREHSPRGILPSAVTVVAVFLVIVAPYLVENQRVFGRFFYNLNSTFFLWCDGWREAQAFAEQYRIHEVFPDARPDQIPGPGTYWRTHTGREIAERLGYGLRSVGEWILGGPFLKYLALAATLCGLLGLRRADRILPLLAGRWAVNTFHAGCFLGYTLVYAWYVPVAYGERFILSLFLPAMYTLLAASKLLGEVPATSIGRAAGSVITRYGTVAIACVAVLDGARVVSGPMHRPTEEFVRFYYNESRELLRRGDDSEATVGFKGVLRLDPTFAPAHHELGMLALRAGRSGEAIAALGRAVELAPGDADMANSLGSALVEAGRLSEAIDVLGRATVLDPDLAATWYNLTGALATAGRLAEAREAWGRLRSLDPDLAASLEVLLAETPQPLPGPPQVDP